jgi:hypothetical protein
MHDFEIEPGKRILEISFFYSFGERIREVSDIWIVCFLNFAFTTALIAF